MKTLKCYVTFLFFLLTIGFSNAQQKTSISPTTETTFTVEINSKTTFDELKEIERMLREDYKVSVSFEEVNLTDNQITSIREQIKNDNQSLMKSIQNLNAPIHPFQIVLKETDKGKYNVTLADHTAKWANAKRFFEEQDSFFHTDFRQLNEQMNRMMQEAESSFSRYRNLFEELEKDPNAKKETKKNNDGTTTTIIHKSI